MKKQGIQSIREVARLAGVAPSTVSLVRNGTGRVSQQTRERVLRIIDESGYLPGRAGRKRRRPASTRRPLRTNRIALIHAGMSRSALQTPVYLDVLRGVEAAASAAGCSLVLRHLPPDHQFSTDLLPQRVDGVILFGAPIDAYQAMIPSTQPCVRVMGNAGMAEPWDCVTYANEPIGRMAAGYLRQRGHTCAAVIAAATGNTVFSERAEAFSAAWLGGGGRLARRLVEPALLVDDGISQRIDPSLLRAGMDILFAGPQIPTGLFLVADMLAGPVQAELLRRGLLPGRDIDLIACNNERLLLDPLDPRPATIDIHAFEVGQRATAQLLWRIDHPVERRHTVLIEPHLVEGDQHFTHMEPQRKQG